MKKLHAVVGLGILLLVGCVAPTGEVGEVGGEPESVGQTGQAVVASSYEYPTAAAFVVVENLGQDRCSGTLLGPSWLITTKSCTGRRGLLPNPNLPARAADLKIATPTSLGLPPNATVSYTSTVGAEIYWHPTVDLALIRTAAPIALETPNFVRNFYRGPTSDYQNYRVTCHGFHSRSVVDRYAELRFGSFVVANVQGGGHRLTNGLGLSVSGGNASLENADRGGACLTSDGQIVSLITQPVGAAAANVETFREWTLDMMHLAENRRLRLPTRFQNASVADCIDLPSGASQEGGAVNHFPCHAGLNQQFYREPAGSGSFRLVSVVTGKCLDVPSLAAGGTVVQTSCDPRRAGQVVDLAPSGTGAILRLRNSFLGMGCIEITPGATQLRLGSCDLQLQSLRQRWSMWTPPPIF